MENRQAIPDDFDEDIYEPGGVLIYHIDEVTNGGILSVRFNEPAGHPNQNGWPGNGNHYPVALLQADGLYELEQGINNGDVGDFYNSPEQSIEPNGGSGSNFPNTDSYIDGNIVSTGISIRNFNFVDGTDPSEITFDVIGLQQAQNPDTPPPTPTPDTPAPTASPSSSPSGLPSALPSDMPSAVDATSPPSEVASSSPTAVESEVPTTFQTTMFPSMFPSMSPTNVTATLPPVPATMSPTRTPVTLGPIAPVAPPNLPLRPRPKGLIDFPLKGRTNGLAPTVLIKPTPNPVSPPIVEPPPIAPPPVSRPYTYYYYACGDGKGKGGSKKFGGAKEPKCKKKVRREKRPYVPAKEALKFETKGSSSKQGKGGPNDSFYDFHSYRKGPPKGP